ncbi:hypothetical protein CWI37_2144p0010 [Hamiltosporidium tvaerminnensis]|uniref:Integrase zinc-binding domain-containing protein n=1 Tax=Hamiltosporidium tvaerminnensis TaxID=1176355 RepID=A0A4Q9KSD9_9MICR|nr:hypothetical protein CWI37_2144p0010 [Hamiltosporidium tvaerminnensis]
MLGDYICFKRRDHLIRAVFGFKTVLIKQIIQTEHALAHIRVNKMMALFVEKYYGIPKAYIKEYVKDCEACERRRIEHLNNVVYAYKRYVNSFNNSLSESIIVENEASTIVPAIDIDHDIIRSDVAKNFKKHRKRIIESKNSNEFNFDDKKDFDMNTKTKSAPFDSFYVNFIFKVIAILMNNMIKVKNKDGETRKVFRGVTKRI